MANFKLNLGSYGHNLLAYERDARGENLHSGVNLHREQICTRVQIAHMNTAIQAWLTRNNVAWSNDLLKVELL